MKWDADAIGAATGTSSWKSWLAGAWILGALIGLVLFASAWSRLFARLAGRLELKDGPLRETLDELSRRAGLRGHEHDEADRDGRGNDRQGPSDP